MITVVIGENSGVMKALAQELAGGPTTVTVVMNHPTALLPPQRTQKWTSDLVAEKEVVGDAVIVTYDELLFRRLQRLVAEETLDTFAAYYVDVEGNATTLHVDQFGRVTNWVDGMFGDAVGEIGAQMKAMFKRLGAQ